MTRSGKTLSFILMLSFLIAANPTFSQKEFYTNPRVEKAKYFRKTKPLREMEQIAPGIRDRSWKDQVIRNEENVKEPINGEGTNIQDPVLQEKMGLNSGRAQDQNFDGISNVNGVYPPDTDGDVGPNHYFQMVNLSFAIYDKQGNLLYGPVDNSTLWNGFIGPWTGTNDGDPIVLYDEIADRWLASQFAVNTSNGTYWQLIAISQTNDPTGSYYQYAFQFPDFNDYPKFGIWPDGYYASFNIFGSYTRVAAAAFERDEMLVGNPNANMVLFDLPAGSDPWGMLPSDFDGTPPPTGTPNYFAYFNDDAWGYPTDELRIWEFDVDWTTPSNSTFAYSLTLQTAPFDYDICNNYRERCIPQLNTSRQLEAISDRLMFRLQYRNFGTYETMVTNHTVDAGGGIAGIRWYELRDSGSGWQIHQQGTYSPDNDHRWMGSIAMDASGNIALGYSVSSSSMHPAIRYTGRLSTDPAGQMTMAEDLIMAGTGSQTGSASRWGDYSMMAVDPTNGTTFWYTTEYLNYTGTAPWRTRIASFYFQSPLPSVYAGDDMTTCENDPVQTNPTVTNQSSVLWTTTGDGTFNDPTLLVTTYTPGSGDLTHGDVDLILTAYAMAPLTDSIKDTTNLDIIFEALANAGDDTTICENAFFTTQPVVQNTSDVLWDTDGDGTFIDPTAINADYYPGTGDISNGSVNLTLNAYSQSPCSGTSIDDMTLNFQYLPTAGAGNDGEICEDETYQLSGTATNQSSVLWSTSGDGTFSNPNILNPVYTPGTNDISSGAATLTLTAYATTPCTNDTADDMLLTINELPDVDAGNDIIIQYSMTTTLNGSASGGSGDFSYLWTPQSLVVNPASPTTQTVNLYNSTVFTLTVTDNITGCENSDNVTVTVQGGPLSAQASATPSDVCVGESTQLDVLASGGTGNYSYNWESDPPGFTSTIKDPLANPTVNTTYTVTVDDGNSIATSSVDVTAQEPPLADAGIDTTICHDQTITLYGSAANYNSTLWTTNGDGSFDDATLLNATYTPGNDDISNGTVNLTLTAGPISPCSDDAEDEMTVTIDICSGLQEIVANNLNMKILPNPNRGIFEISVSGMDCNKLQLSVYDLKGVTLYQKEFIARDGIFNKDLNLRSLEQGLYLIQLKCEDEVVTGKLVIK